MDKAWLGVELRDYERHVELEYVGQAAAIRSCLAGAIEERRPKSLLYLGCAGGNGLEAAAGVERVVGVDLNQRYLDTAAQRYPNAEFLCWDLNDGAPHIPPVDLIFGALILEFVASVEALLRGLASRVNPSGHLVALLLGTHGDAPAILPSPYRAALAGVGAEYSSIARDEIVEMARAAGWGLAAERTLELPSRKYFSELTFRLAPAPHTANDSRG